MPFYEVQHSYPLTAAQRQSFAQAITRLHSTTFLTPSLFVNVVFHHLPPTTTADSAGPTYFLAGEPTRHHPQGPNRILAMVRTSPQRTKAAFDALAAEIEAAWYVTVNDADDQEDRPAKKMHFVVFYPMLAARENGVTIPDAGNEGSWLRDNMPYFKSQAYDHDDEDFRKMIQEIDHRDDLKALIS